MLNPASNLPLRDPSLFRQANYIDGKWVESDSGKTLTVRNPATGEPDRRSARDGRGGNPPRDRGGGPRLSTLARLASQGSGGDLAAAFQAHDREHRGSRRDHDRRAGQAARREPGRDRLRRLLHRVVRRGGQARLRRHHPAAGRRRGASWCSSSRSACAPRSRRGTSRPR